LPATHAFDGEQIASGRIYIAPPNCHLLISNGRMEVTNGPQENGHRPAIDPLFRSAALAYGPRVIGVVLSGTLDDGSAGLAAIRRAGGIAVVQDPEDAIFPEMPRNALELVGADYVLPVNDMVPVLERLTKEPTMKRKTPKGVRQKSAKGAVSIEAAGSAVKSRRPSAFTCPVCSGPMEELHNGDLLRFKCRVGHSYTLASMVAEHGEFLERALWLSMRTLEDSAKLHHHMAERARKSRRFAVAERYEMRAEARAAEAQLLREILTRGDTDEVEAATEQKEAQTPTEAKLANLR
jgi:two-component system chemotaxis response regulator CheB